MLRMFLQNALAWFVYSELRISLSAAYRAVVKAVIGLPVQFFDHLALCRTVDTIRWVFRY